jgi:hypothetical protein
VAAVPCWSWRSRGCWRCRSLSRQGSRGCRERRCYARHYARPRRVGLLGLITAPIGRLHYHSVASIRSFSSSATVRLLLLTMLHCHQARVPMLPSQLLSSCATPQFPLPAQYLPSCLFPTPTLKLAVCIGCRLPLQSGTPVQHQPWRVFEPSPPPFWGGS